MLRNLGFKKQAESHSATPKVDARTTGRYALGIGGGYLAGRAAQFPAGIAAVGAGLVARPTLPFSTLAVRALPYAGAIGGYEWARRRTKGLKKQAAPALLGRAGAQISGLLSKGKSVGRAGIEYARQHPGQAAAAAGGAGILAGRASKRRER